MSTAPNDPHEARKVPSVDDLVGIDTAWTGDVTTDQYIAQQRGPKITEQQFQEAFTEAWMKCMNEHRATLATGPCDLCTVEAGERLRAAASSPPPTAS